MKLLFVCNTFVNIIAKELKMPEKPIAGWIESMIYELLKTNVEIVFIFPHNHRVIGESGKLKFYSFFENKDGVDFFTKIINDEQPDVVHIFGTEMKHSYHALLAAEKLNLIENTIVHIQGVTLAINKYYAKSLPTTVKFGFSFRDLLRVDNIYFQNKKFFKRSLVEKKIFEKIKYVSGRTEFDRGYTYLYNNSIKYISCNEMLRPSFYFDKWDYNKCEKNSIFISQVHYPVKGFHIFLKALIIIKKFIPDIKVYTTGKDIINTKFSDSIKLTNYYRYLRKLIKKNKLENNIKFLGVLSEKQIKNRLLNSNLFVSCSVIENSPNSLGEAMILGVPSISSNVGGVSSMGKHNFDCVLYQYDDENMIAYNIIKLLNDVDMQNFISKNAIISARKMFDISTNFNKMKNIYEQIMRKE